MSGRIDLVKRLETDETSIVDFKSTADSQQTSVTKDQLSIYALGYQELTGQSADTIQILNLDAKSDDYTARVDDALLTGIKIKVQAVAADIRSGHFDCGHDHTKEGAYNDLEWLTNK